MKIISIGYVPPPSFGFPEAFLANIRRFSHKYDLLLYSDHSWPDTIRLKGSPETVKEATHAGHKNRWAVNNLIWLTGLCVAKRAGADFVIYLEADCRIGRDDWDARIFDEVSRLIGKADSGVDWDFIAAGSMVWYWPCNHSKEVARKWAETVSRWNRRRTNLPVPIPAFGMGGSNEKQEPSCFVNGALGLYNMRFMEKFFELPEVVPNPNWKAAERAQSMRAWDYVIGEKAWQMFGLGAFDKILDLTSVFSSYGDVLTSEDDRRELLKPPTAVGIAAVTARQVVAVHQIKSNWAGPEVERKVEPTAPVSEPENPVEVVEKVSAQQVVANPRVKLFLTAEAGRDALLCSYALRSIERFASGFAGVTVLVPERDADSFETMCAKYGATLATFKPHKAARWTQMPKILADQHCLDADVIAHINPDQVFIQETTPADLIEKGKPVVYVEFFETLRTQLMDYGRKAHLDDAMGWDVAWDTVRLRERPVVHHCWLYDLVRRHVASVQGKEVRSFDPLRALGSFAHRLHYDAYVWQDLTGLKIRPAGNLQQVDLSSQGRAEVESALA